MQSPFSIIFKSTNMQVLFAWFAPKFAVLRFALLVVCCSTLVYAQSPATQQAMELTQEGKFQEARDAWMQLAAQHPADYIVQANLGLTLAHLGQYQEATRAYRKALVLRPNQPEIELNLGLAEFKQGDFAAAISSFNAAAATAKAPDPRIETLLGISYYGEGQYAKAIPHLTVASANDPANHELHYVLAESCLHSRKPE